MLSLAGRYDTAVLVSGDEDFVYAVNAVAYKGCRVEIAGFRSNTAPKLIDVADYFIDLGEIADKVRKELPHGARYDELGQPAYLNNGSESVESHVVHDSPPIGFDLVPPHIEIGSTVDDDTDQFDPASDLIRVTDDH